jgi:hypothetical protein
LTILLDSKELWMGLQMEYERRKAGQKYAEAIKREVLPLYGD